MCNYYISIQLIKYIYIANCYKIVIGTSIKFIVSCYKIVIGTSINFIANYYEIVIGTLYNLVKYIYKFYCKLLRNSHWNIIQLSKIHCKLL